MTNKQKDKIMFQPTKEYCDNCKREQKQKIIEEIEKMDFEFLYKSQVEDVKKELLKTLGEKQ